MFDGNSLLDPLTAVSKLAILVPFGVVMDGTERSWQNTLVIPASLHLRNSL